MNTSFWSLPQTSGNRDYPVGVDELGNTVYSTAAGDTYTVRTQPANRESVLGGLWNALSADPVGFGRNMLAGAAEGVWSGVSAPGRAASGEPVTYGDAAELAGMVSLPALAGRYDPAVANMGIRAYHGSPHDFDRFSMDKIGTGEGAQTYGHGLYFAEAEDVARGYRDRLSNPDIRAPGTYEGPSLSKLDPVESLMLTGLGDPYMHRPVSDAVRMLRNLKRHVVDDARLPDYDEAIKRLESAPRYDGPTPRMYEVNINADPADFLDWDAPLSEQPQKVRDAFAPRIDQLKQAGARFSEDPTGDMLWRSSQDQGGVDVLDMTINPASTGARRLREAGIPGIKYYDGMSRAGGEGTRNYVVFDENLIDIVRKYGWAAAAPLFANQLAPQGEQY